MFTSEAKGEFAMIKYDELLNDAEEEHITVIENYDFSDTRIDGLYCDGMVALNKHIRTEKEKKCILAEELGHHFTAVGDITDQTCAFNRKQELYGRAYAYNKLVGLMGIIDAYQHNCTSLEESAEHLDVTPEFLKEAVSYYRSKYGTSVTVDKYTIFFEPYIAVLEIVESAF